MESRPREENAKELQANTKGGTGSESESSNSVVCIYQNQVKVNEPVMQKQLSIEIARQLSQKIEMSFSKTTSGLLVKYPTKADAAMDRIELVDRFVKLAQVASSTVLDDMLKILDQDPKRFMIERDDPLHLINQHNSSGFNAAYVAAKNGNLKVLKFLFQNKALLKLPSIIKNKFSEQPIEAAARWQHHQAVIWMIDHLKFQIDIMDSVYSKTESKQVKSRIASKTSFCVRLKTVLCRCF